MKQPSFWTCSLWFLALVCLFGIFRVLVMIYQPDPARQSPLPVSHQLHDAILTTQQAYEREKKEFSEREKQGTDDP